MDLKQLFHIKPAYPAEGDKALSIRIGQQHCSFAVTDKPGNNLYALSYYIHDEINSDVLGMIYSQHPELHDSFCCVQVCYDYPDSVLVPVEHHNPEGQRSLLATMYGGSVASSVISEPVHDWKLYNVFALPDGIREWVGRMFPAYKDRHQYTMTLEMMPTDSADHLLIDFTPGEFSFIVLKENKILIAQTLAYTTPEDILYYLLKTCNQFSLSRGEVQLFISGMIEKKSQLYRELYLYFLNVSFREPAWKMVSNEEDDYPAHFFTSLNDLARCAS